MPSTSTGSATTWPSGPTGSAAATGSSGPAGRTSARPSTPASGRTTPSSPRSQPLWPPAPSGTSARPWTTGATLNSGPGSPRTKRPDIDRRRLLPGGRQHEGDPLRREAEDETPLPGQRQAGLHPAQGHLLRGQHPEGERPVVHLPEALEATGAPTGTGPQGWRASTPASTHWAPTPTGRSTENPKASATKWRRN